MSLAMMNGTAATIGTSKDGYSVLETTIFAVVAGILSLLTILGNVLVMVSFKMDKQLQTISNYFLLSLAVADFFIGLISMPLYTLYLLPFPRWPLGPFICDLWLSCDYLVSNSSVLNLLVISFDRYFSVTRPLTYRVRRTTKRACLMISMTWFISLILWPPWIFAWPYIEGVRSVPPDDCYIQFLETNPYITFGTAIAAFYIPVTIMCILYWRVWRETEKRYKDLTTLFLVSAVGGRVRTTPGTHGGCDVDEDETFADRFKSFLTWPVNIFGSKKSTTESTNIEDRGTEGDMNGPEVGTQTSSIRPHRGDDPTSTTEDDDEDDSDATCGTGSSAGGTKRSALASDSIYTILITLGDGVPLKPGHKSHNNQLLTPTTTASSAALTPLTETGPYSIDEGETHTIKQFFESAISIANIPDEIGEDTQSQRKFHASNLPSADVSNVSNVSNGSNAPTKSHASSSTSNVITFHHKSPMSMKRPSAGEKPSQEDGKRKVSETVRTVPRPESPGSGLRMHSGRSASNSGLSSTKTHMSTVSQPKSEKKAAKTLSAILLTFIITWTPYNVLVLIKTLSPSDSEVISDSLWYFSYYLCYINSTINPLCYALCNVNFRNTYLRILKCQWTLNPTRQRVKDAQFDLPPAQSRKEKKKRNKKRNKILASRQQQMLQQQSIQTSHRNTLGTNTGESSIRTPLHGESSIRPPLHGGSSVKPPLQQQQSLQRQQKSPPPLLPSGGKQSSTSFASNLTGSNLTGSNLTGTSLTGSNLTGSNLTGSNLTGSNLTGSSDSKLLVTATSTGIGRGERVTTMSVPPTSKLSTIQQQQQMKQATAVTRKTKKNSTVT